MLNKEHPELLYALKNITFFKKMIKKIVYFIILFISITNLFAQDPTKFIAIDSNGNTYEIDPLNCSYTPISQCGSANPFSIALINDYVYFTDWLSLYRFQYTSVGNCEFLGTFNYTGSNNLSGLTSGPDGKIYAAAGNTIFKYDPTTDFFTNLGNIPSQWLSSGDLVFFNGQLLLSTINDKLIKIDLENLSNSQVVLSFPTNTEIFGLSTITPPCGSNQLYAINSSGDNTTLLPINLTSNTVGNPTCIFPFQIYDTASLSENGSSTSVIPTFNPIAPICTGATLSALPTVSNNGISGTWWPALNNTATTTYTFTPLAGQCASTAAITITVNSSLAAVFTQVPPICSGETLSVLPTTSTNGITGTWSPVMNNTATTTYTFTSTTGACGTTMTIVVNPQITPTFTQVPTICYGATLTALPITSTNGITGSWSPALNNTATTIYTFTPNSGQCAITTTMTITVNPIPGNPIGILHPEICSGETTTINVNFTPVVAGTVLKWEVIDSSNNTSGFTPSGIGSPSVSISDNLVNESNSQGFVTYRITSFIDNCEGTFIDITVIVNPLPNPDLQNGSICVNQSTGATYLSYLLDAQLTDSDYSYEWSILNTSTSTFDLLSSTNGPTFEATQEGTYQVVVTNTTTNCKQKDEAIVSKTYPAEEIFVTVTDNFTDNTTITVLVNQTGSNNLIYSLDNGIWQDSNIFTGVNSGKHTINVMDLESCTNLTTEIFVIDYPKFFTPNGDNINDNWNIIGLNQKDAKLFIFDRYGKLIKQLSTTSKGWDGNYNGEKLPSSDYWFTLDFTENGVPKQFKSHFALKR